MMTRTILTHLKAELLQLRRPAVVITALGFLVVGVAVMAERSQPLTAYQVQLRSQVQATNGAPLDGRDPAAQGQTTLADAASQPVGNGLRTDTPAAAVMGDHSHHVMPTDVLPDAHKTGRQFNGCLIGYPAPGETCVTNAQPGSQMIGCVLQTLACNGAAATLPRKNQ